MRRPIFLLSLFLLLSSFAVFPQISFAQDDPLATCASTSHYWSSSPTYEPDGVIVRYEARNQRIILVSWHTGDVIRELETSLVAHRVDDYKLSWSPNCHYLFGVVDDQAVIWDALNGGRVNDFTIEPAVYQTAWNPERDNLILHGETSAYLWNFTQSAPIPLTFSGKTPWSSGWYFPWQIAWDNQRNQVLTVPAFTTSNLVVIYDQTTAQQIAYFDNGGRQGPVAFALTSDNRSIIVFTIEGPSLGSDLKGITVWDRDTMEHVTVSANTQSAKLLTQIALSPDRHYLVLARIGHMRVWDLSNLAPDINDRDPIGRYRIEPNTQSVRFVGETVVETTNFQGESQRWDVLTGEPAP